MNPRIFITLLATLLAGCATNRRAFELAGAKSQITELHMLTIREGWAWSGGLAGQRLLLRTSDGGTTWQDVTPFGFPHEEEGACFHDPRTAWVPIFNRTNVTAGLLHTTNGGKSWLLLNQTNTPIFNEASSCRFYSPTYGVGNSSDNGAGSAYITFFETFDSGKTWSRIPFTPRNPDMGEYTNTFHLSNIGGDSITFHPPASVIITYGDTADEKPKGILRFSRTTDLGKNWRDIELPLLKQYEDSLCVPLEPVFVDEKNIVLAAHVFESTTNGYSNGALIFYTSHDGGATWTAKQGMLDLKQPSYGNTFDVVSPECFFIANGSHIFVTHDGAQSWQAITPNISFGENSKRDIAQMKFLDAKHGWLIISDNNGFHPDGNCILYRTSDGGRNWAEMPVRIPSETVLK
jgi:photosystem II stability/assembly factor-like uncharacterized protein